MHQEVTKTFQFHNGTIKPSEKANEEVLKTCFNSTTVQLSPSVPGACVFLHTCFNSTTVQLSPRLTQEKSPINEFQFHNGTIKPKYP